jgi:hypothetical protein
VETPADSAAAVLAQDVELLPPLISRNDLTFDIRGLAVIRSAARGDSGETVPVLVRDRFTRFLTFDGTEVAPALHKNDRFAASGEIRLIALNRPSNDAPTVPAANTLVGEVIRVQEMLPDRFDGAQLREPYRDQGLNPGDLIVEIETESGISKTVVFVNNLNLSPRSIPDGIRNLEPGETIIVPYEGVFRPDPYPQNWFKASEGAVVERQLRGTLSEHIMPYNQVTFLGDPAWRCFEILTLAGRRRAFWYHDDSPEPLQLLIGKTVTVTVEPMIDATTILFPPSINSVKSSSLEEFTAELPAHIRVSELLARWEGWSLTVPQPGHTDQEQTDTSLVTPPYSLKAYRPDPATIAAKDRDSWLLPRLRFDRHLQFVLRRTDLAGNHDFEEPALPAVLDATASAELDSVISRSLGMTNAQLASFFQRKVRTPLFRRVDRPLPPLPAFPPDRIAIEQAVKLDPQVPVQYPEFKAVADQRSAIIVMITDACCIEQHDATYADATLLPPSTAVETTMMHGRLDGGAAAAAGSIRDHERHFDPEPDMLGLLKVPHSHGNLNYMPDPASARVAFALELPASAGTAPPEKTAFLYAMDGAAAKWPWAAGMKIALAANGLDERAFPSLVYEVPTAAEPGGVIRVSLPAATDARLIQYFVDSSLAHDSAEWGGWRVVHATNGALMPPSWKSLVELEPAATGPRRFVAEFELHRPSTGAWNVFAYWNEVWDEALPTQFRAAKLLFKFDRKGKRVLSIDVSEPGMGYGSDAVMVWESVPGEEPPKKLPRSRASIVNGVVDSVAVLDGGEGVTAANVRPRLVRRPPLHRTAAASATIVAGSVTRVDVALGQRGGWYVDAPHAILHDRTGQGSGAVLQACLNECGGVEKVIVLAGGRCYSHDVEVRFYTHMERVRDVPVALSPQPDNPTIIDVERIEFTALKPDDRSHVVDFVLQADSRFYPDFLKAPAVVTAMDCDNPKYIVPAAHDVMIHVPRFSARREIALRTRHVVSRPEVDHIIPAFVWRIDGATATAPESASLAGRNRIRIERQATIRVYLHRPWHVGGEEHLGILVRPMISESPPQGVGTPPVDSPVAYSRWGYDPVWNEAEFVPLGEHHLEYGLDRIAVPDPIPVAADDEKCPTRPTTHLCVPHAVHYDSAVERWFADIRLTRAKDLQPNRNPFVQLALVAVQLNGVGGPTQSKPVVCDPVKMVGDRVLEVDRMSAGDFRITLTGSLDQPVRGNSADAVPFRMVIARIEARDARMPELEVLALPESIVVNRPPRRTRVLAEVELPGHQDGSHSGQLTVGPDLLHPKDASEVVMLVVVEHEFYPASDTAQAGRDEDAYCRRDGKLFAGQNMFTGIVWLHERRNP